MRPPRPAPDATWPWQVAKLLILTIGIIGAALLVWQLAHVLLLLFAAVLVAVLLRAGAEFIAAHTSLPERWAVALTCLLAAAALGGFLYLLGAQIRAQAAVLVENLPDLVDTAENWIGFDGIGS